MTERIHPSAFIDPTARLAAGVSVGAFAVVEAGVVVGEGSSIGHHTVVHSGVSMGRENRIFPHAVVGGEPQDLKYAGQPTRLEMGDQNSVREFVSLNRATQEGGGVTRIGNRNLFMAYVHVAHDCQIADDIVFANCATLAGHCHVGSNVVIGGLAAAHQHSRIGTGAMVGGMARISKDVPPYCTIAGTDDVKVYGLNKLGLKRRGMNKADLEALEQAYRIFQDRQLNFGHALAKLEALEPKTEHMKVFVEFLKTSDRGVYR